MLDFVDPIGAGGNLLAGGGRQGSQFELLTKWDSILIALILMAAAAVVGFAVYWIAEHAAAH